MPNSFYFVGGKVPITNGQNLDTTINVPAGTSTIDLAIGGRRPPLR